MDWSDFRFLQSSFADGKIQPGGRQILVYTTVQQLADAVQLDCSLSLSTREREQQTKLKKCMILCHVAKYASAVGSGSMCCNSMCCNEYNVRPATCVSKTNPVVFSRYKKGKNATIRRRCVIMIMNDDNELCESRVKGERIILHKNIEATNISSDAGPGGVLRIMMIACEQLPPYGGMVQTANMFLHLLSTAIREKKSTSTTKAIEISIYNAQEYDYPLSSEEWDSYDGILLPGSHSSAYDDSQPWIPFLRHVIIKEIHHHQRKTLGICFGHQIMAHSVYPDGVATKCSAGPQAGCRRNTLSTLLLRYPEESYNRLDDKKYLLYYTHGDMVAKLPSCSVCLASTFDVDIVAAAFFSSSDDAILFQKQQRNSSYKINSQEYVRPYAITFQAHPEFFDGDGFQHHFHNCVIGMCQSGALSQEASDKELKDSIANKELVWRDTVDIMVQVGSILNWF